MKPFRSAIAAASIFMSVSVASAQVADCTCVTPIAPGGTYPVVGSISSASGDILYSDAAGFVPGGPGTKLSVGTELTTGPIATADINVGQDCNVTVGPSQIASILQPDGATGNLCVRVSDIVSSPDAPTAGANYAAAGNGTGINPLVVAIPVGIIGGVVACVASFCKSDDNPRPASR